MSATRSGCGIMIVTRPSSLDRPQIPSVEPFGLDACWLWDVFREVRASGKVNLVGADLMEYAPYCDPARTFGYYAAAFGWKFLCWLASDVAKRNGERRGTVWPQAFGSVTLG